MRLLVTGGAGYVGSHCVRALCDRGHDVVVYDNLACGHRAAVDRRARLVVGDLGDARLLETTLDSGRFGAVLHFAALAEVGQSVQEPLLYYRTNVANSVTLLERLQAHEIRKFIFSSSCATYGLPPLVPITEDMPQIPINPYGRTKLAIEWVLRDCANAWGLGATALRYFNAAGAASDGTLGEDHDPESHLIPLVLKVALGQRDEIKVFGEDYPTPDGTCIRDYIHVEDLADIHVRAVEAQQEGEFRYYNVGTGSGVSVKQVIDAAREVTKSDIPAVSVPRRSGDPPMLYANCTKIATEFGWRSRFVDIRTIVETAWNWHRSHPNGFASGGG